MQNNNIWSNEISKINRYIDNIQSRVENINNDDAYKPDGKIFNNVITIYGSRGAGKTTLLNKLISKMRKTNKHIILPLIKPDTFAGNDHLLAVVVDAMRELVDDLFQDKCLQEYDEEKYRLIKSGIHELYSNISTYILSSELSTDAYWSRLLSESLDLDYIAVERKELFAAGVKFYKNFNRFVTKLTTVFKEIHDLSHPPLLIVPIDDIDLNIRCLRQLMDCINICTNDSFRLVFIIAVAPQQFPRIVSKIVEERYINHIKQGDKIDNFIIVSGNDYISKFFPPQYSITLEPFSFKERWQFVPLYSVYANQPRKLGELIEDINPNLTRYFFYNDTSNGDCEFTPFMNIFTGNPRLLCSIYEFLKHHINEDVSTYKIVKHLYHIVININSTSPLNQIIKWHDEQESILFKFHQINFRLDTPVLLKQIFGIINNNEPIYLFKSFPVLNLFHDLTQNETFWFLFLYQLAVDGVITSTILPGIIIDYNFQDRIFIPYFKPGKFISLNQFMCPMHIFKMIHYLEMYHDHDKLLWTDYVKIIDDNIEKEKLIAFVVSMIAYMCDILKRSEIEDIYINIKEFNQDNANEIWQSYRDKIKGYLNERNISPLMKKILYDYFDQIKKYKEKKQ